MDLGYCRTKTGDRGQNTGDSPAAGEKAAGLKEQEKLSGYLQAFPPLLKVGFSCSFYPHSQLYLTRPWGTGFR
jgi:hypothetical protein